jgi:galactokinase
MATFVAPGRVNLMGDHTDYNDGFVLPLAIDRACTVVTSPAPGHLVTATSRNVDGRVAVPVDGTADPATTDPRWGGFVAGVVGALVARGVAVAPSALVVDTKVPVGSGLSSSSALSVALTLALGGTALDRLDAARAASDAETTATGVRGGLMDQLASLFGQAGHALLIDCRGHVVTPVAMPPSVAVLVVHCGVPRTLVGSEYASRRAECEAIAARLGITALRDAVPEQVRDAPRARHVVAENGRVLAMAGALPHGDLSVLGPLLLESHASLRDDYEVSTPELDTLVDVLVECGAAGARLTGAGFGGCVVALAQRNHADDVLAKATRRYHDATGIEATGFVAQAVDGARRVD